MSNTEEEHNIATKIGNVMLELRARVEILSYAPFLDEGYVRVDVTNLVDQAALKGKVKTLFRNAGIDLDVKVEVKEEL